MAKTSQATEDFILTAYNSGVPRDQLENFLRGGYVALPWQLKFHAVAREADNPTGAVDVGVGGARGPGKSHGVFAQIALDDCQRVPGLKCLFLRQTGKSAGESFEDLVLKVLASRVKYEYNRSLHTLKFPNGSRILLGGFENEKDIDKYVGIEYDLIGVEERNQLTGEKILKLKGSLRTSKEGWRPRMYSSFNPGGIGHNDVKITFVEPFRAGTETKTKFIPATYKENPYLNIEYIDYLESLPGDLGKMWREGEWDIFAGQFFSEWRHDYHVVKPFPIPTTWKKLRSIDVSGRSGITSCHWYAIDYNGDVFAYREYYSTGKDSDEHAREITRLSEGESYPYTVIDSAAFSKIGLPETVAEVYIKNGVQGLVPSSKNRVQGWDFMHQYLRWKESENPVTHEKIMTGPKLKYFETCTEAIRTIPTLIHDERDPEDLDTRGEDHAADEARYLLQTLRELKTPQPMNIVERRLAALRGEVNSFGFGS